MDEPGAEIDFTGVGRGDRRLRFTVTMGQSDASRARDIAVENGRTQVSGDLRSAGSFDFDRRELCFTSDRQAESNRG